MAIKVVSLATSTLMIEVSDLQLRLGAKDSDQPALERIMKSVYRMICRRLGYSPAYQEYQESFRYVDDVELSLTCRPFVALSGGGVWSPGEDGQPDLALTEDVDFVVEGDNPAILVRESTWALGFVSPFFSQHQEIGFANPDWIVQHRAGFWFPSMTGTKPDDVQELDEDLAEAAWLMVMTLYSVEDTNPLVHSFAKLGTRVQYKGTSDFPVQVESILADFSVAVI